jgi:hypothetical protein
MAARNAARTGAAEGDERYLTARDKGPQKRLVRDFVDSQFSLGQLLMPALSHLGDSYLCARSARAKDCDDCALRVSFMLIINSVLIGRAAKRMIADRFGEERVEPGIIRYAAMRSAQSRFLRMPKPKVRRGEKP